MSKYGIPYKDTRLTYAQRAVLGLCYVHLSRSMNFSRPYDQSCRSLSRRGLLRKTSAGYRITAKGIVVVGIDQDRGHEPVHIEDGDAK